MKTLSTLNCPDCNSDNIHKTNWKPYDNVVYKCKECNTQWDKNTRYCNRCKDVAMYCECYKDL